EHDEKSIPLRFIGTHRDITDRKKAEDALQLRDNYLSALNKANDVLLKGNFDEQLNEFVKIVGKLSQASRTYIFKNHKNEKGNLLLSQLAEYVAEGIKPEIDNPQLQNLSYNDFLPRWAEILSKGNIINGKVAEFPETEREILEPQEIKAILVLPIFAEDEFWGFIGFDNCKNDNEWSKSQIDYLKAASIKLENRIVDIRNKQNLNEHLKFIEFTNSIAADFINIKSHETNKKIIKLLEQTAKHNSLERAYVFLLSDNQQKLLLTQEWCDHNVKAHKGILDNVNTADFKDFETLKANKNVSLNISDLENTPENKAMLDILNLLEIKSFINLPMLTEGKLIGYIGFDSTKKEFVWTEKMLDSFTVCKEIIANAIEFEKSNLEIRKLSQFVKTTNEAVVLTEPDGTIIFVNDALLQLGNWENSAEILQKSIFNFTDNNGREKLQNEAIPSLLKEEKYFGEFTMVKKDESTYPAELRCSIIKDNFGKPEYLVAIFNDITERKKTEKTTKEQARLLDLIFKHSLDSIVLLDKNYNFIRVSESYAKACQRDSSEFPGNNHFEFYPSDFKDEADEAKKEKSIYQNSERPFIFPDHLELGATYWDLGLVPILDEDGEIELFLFTLKDVTERKQAEEALKESEEKFRAITESAIDSIFIKDINLKYIHVNPAMENLFGVSASSLIGKTDIDLFGDEIGKEVTDLDKKVLQGEILIDEHEKTANGKTYSFHAIKAPMKNSEGKIIGICGIARDVTENKQAEKELTKLSTAVKQSPSVIAITDTKGKLEYVNPKFTELTGYTFEEAIGLNPRVLKSGEQPDEMYKELWKTVSRKKVWRGEFHNKKKNGELFWEMASVSPIFDEKGKIINYIKVAEDITWQKRNEQIQSIIHNISNAVITSHSPENFLALVKNELGKLIDTTNFFVALYDEKTDCISLLLHHDEKDRWESFPSGKSLTKYVIKTGKPLLAKKAMIEKLIKSGEIELVGHPAEVWLGVPLKSKNKVTGIFDVQSYDNENAFDEADLKMLEIISHQISLSLERLKAEEDLKLAKEKAEESDRLKSAFLTNMSHEIRTPMNGILGFTELLKETQLSGDEKEQYIQLIEKSGNRMLNTINDIIDISKIEAGQEKVANSEVSVNSLLDEQFNFFQRETKSKGLELNYRPSLTDSESRIITDPHKLEGILTNLLKNAVKFTQTGEITLGCRIKDKADGKFIEFYVKDTG
ncbi:MAG: PAS domain S-box protein, partial [Bacteroidota bacterium]|nr:PAS domain S-box protein [Bacteroidota bacterium]